MRTPRSAARFLACRTVHSRVGQVVTPVLCRRLVPCSRNAGAYSRLPSAVSRAYMLLPLGAMGPP